MKNETKSTTQTAENSKRPVLNSNGSEIEQLKYLVQLHENLLKDKNFLIKQLETKLSRYETPRSKKPINNVVRKIIPKVIPLRACK